MMYLKKGLNPNEELLEAWAKGKKWPLKRTIVGQGPVNLNVGQPFQLKQKKIILPRTFQPEDRIYHKFLISSGHEKVKDTSLIFSACWC